MGPGGMAYQVPGNKTLPIEPSYFYPSTATKTMGPGLYPF